jgi:hypothetical protein
VIDRYERAHLAYYSNGEAIYGVLRADTWDIERAAGNVGQLINDQSLLVDKCGHPYLIYQNSLGNMVVTGKQFNKWVEFVDFGPGQNGTMLFDSSGAIHASFTASDFVVRYERIHLSPA